MKKVAMIINIWFCILGIVLISGCSNQNQNQEQLSADSSRSQSLPESESALQLETQEHIDISNIEKEQNAILGEIPELVNVAAFIEQQSGGRAHLVVQDYEPVEIWESESLHRPVYVGEEWTDGTRINWYWFYICEESGNVLVDSYYSHMEGLDEWRSDEIYLEQMQSIEDTISAVSGAEGNPDSWTGADDMPNSTDAYNAYDEFLKGRRIFYHNGYVRVIDDVMDIMFEDNTRRYTFYDITGDGVPELILQGTRMYILTYRDGDLSVMLSDEYYGGSQYFVNGGNIYYRHGGIANKLIHAYGELDENGNEVRCFDVILYAHYNDETDSWWETYTYSEGEEEQEQEITEGEYEELVAQMSDDSEIEWQSFQFPESTLKGIR